MTPLIYQFFTPKGPIKISVPFSLSIGTEIELGDEMYKVMKPTEEGFDCEFLYYV